MTGLRRALFALSMLGVVAAQPATAAQPPALPCAVVERFPGLRPLGSARFDFFLMHVYDATLWSANAPWTPEALFALDIRYAREVKGRDLAARSVEEMRRLGHRDTRALARWEAAMARVFPDIRKGDRLVGVQVGHEAHFFNEQGTLGVIADLHFARAFFAIWLDAGTREPAMRRKLLGLPE
jgi:hypothetical protein